jgi:hypothetical protein
LKKFSTCPYQYYRVKVIQNCQDVPNEKTLYGTAVHAALEAYARHGTPLPKNYSPFKPYVDALLEIEGDRYIEHEMALDTDLNPCEFNNPDRFVRGIVDYMCITRHTCYMIDYKTGSSRYADSDQLALMALLTFAHFPQVNQVRGGLLFLAENRFIDVMYKRRYSAELWDRFRPQLVALEYSKASNHWPQKPSGLCVGYCPVKDCPYHREKY